MAKFVRTFDDTGKANGYLIELIKDGHKTVSYLTAIYQRCKKGYHLHQRRESNYMCVAGSVDVVWFEKSKVLDTSSESGISKFLAHKSDHFSVVKCSAILWPGFELKIKTYCPVALFNNTDAIAELVNMPEPPYDPKDKEEQLEFTNNECMDGMFPGWEGDTTHEM